MFKAPPTNGADLWSHLTEAPVVSNNEPPDPVIVQMAEELGSHLTEIIKKIAIGHDISLWVTPGQPWTRYQIHIKEGMSPIMFKINTMWMQDPDVVSSFVYQIQDALHKELADHTRTHMYVTV